MSNQIPLPGLRAENLLGFLAALGTMRVIQSASPNAKMFWKQTGGGWVATLDLESSALSNANEVAVHVAELLQAMPQPHWVLGWERFLSKAFVNESDYYTSSVVAWLGGDESLDHLAVFSAQLPEASAIGELEHFDHPFRAARKDYFPGNLRSVIENTKESHILRTIARTWDYQDAMANQSLRLDHGDDRRHAYQWYAPTEDPARQKVGCMLGANRLAVEAFPFFPCLPQSNGGTAIGFQCDSKTYTWVRWPIWERPCSSSVIATLLNLTLSKEEKNLADLKSRGITAVLQSRRLPVEKNKVFLPPTLL